MVPARGRYVRQARVPLQRSGRRHGHPQVGQRRAAPDVDGGRQPQAGGYGTASPGSRMGPTFSLMADSSRVVVALPERLHPEFLEAVRGVSPRIETVLLSNDQALPPEVDDVTVFYRSYALRGRVVNEVLARASHLRWMHVPSAGVDIILKP